jgi:hypothetical protein
VVILPCTGTEVELKVVIKGMSLICNWSLLAKIFENRLMCSIVMSLPLSRHPTILKFLRYVSIYILRSDSFLEFDCHCCLLGNNRPFGFPLTGLTVVLWFLATATLLILTEYAVADILPYSAKFMSRSPRVSEGFTMPGWALELVWFWLVSGDEECV